MRGTSIIVVVVALMASGVVLYSCDAPQVWVSVRNDYFETVSDITVADVAYGTLEQDAESEAKPLASGTWNIRGVTQTGLRLRARIAVVKRTQVRIIITNKGGIRLE